MEFPGYIKTKKIKVHNSIYVFFKVTNAQNYPNKDTHKTGNHVYLWKGELGGSGRHKGKTYFSLNFLLYPFNFGPGSVILCKNKYKFLNTISL